MNIQALKLELVSQILNTESRELLNTVWTMLKKEVPDFVSRLSEEDKNEIEISRKQIAKGQTESWESLYRRLA